jgi:hypothetical protein
MSLPIESAAACTAAKSLTGYGIFPFALSSFARVVRVCFKMLCAW